MKLSLIEKLPEVYDHKKLLADYESCKKNDQILITSIDGNTYQYETGDLTKYDLDQKDFNVVNKFFKGTYTEQVYNDLNQKYNICRARFLTLDKIKRAYSYHYDLTKRIHIPLQTTELSMFYHEDQIYRMPDVGQSYLVDTTKMHSFLHLHREIERIHFVVCLKE